MGHLVPPLIEIESEGQWHTYALMSLPSFLWVKRDQQHSQREGRSISLKLFVASIPPSRMPVKVKMLVFDTLFASHVLVKKIRKNHSVSPSRLFGSFQTRFSHCRRAKSYRTLHHQTACAKGMLLHRLYSTIEEICNILLQMIWHLTLRRI
jgi:hypothetical protein